MKSTSQAITDYLHNEKIFKTCDLYCMILKNGSRLYYADYDIDISWAGVTWSHNAFLWKREQIKTNGAISVDSLNVVITCDAQDKINNVPFLKACHNGALDGAILVMYKAYFRTDGIVVDAYAAFQGRIEVSEAGGIKSKLVIKSEAQSLNQKVPVRIFAPQCAYTKNSSGAIISSSSDTATAMIPFKPSAYVLLRY